MSNYIYLLPISETFSTAWQKLKGAKCPLWAAFFIGLFITICLAFAYSLLKKFPIPGIHFVVPIIIQLIGACIYGGIIYLGIKRAEDSPIIYSMMFRAFEGRISIRVFAVWLLQTFILMVPSLIVLGAVAYMQLGKGMGIGGVFLAILLCVIATLSTIYLHIRVMFAPAFIVDKGANPWFAITQSFAITKGNVLQLLMILALQALLMAISAIPLGIGLIWTFPLSFVLYGVLYKELLTHPNTYLPRSN